MKTITHFTFDRAQYRLEDSDGKSVVLKMFYAENRYEVDGERTELVDLIARDLLKKKHATNFAYKFNGYESL